MADEEQTIDRQQLFNRCQRTGACRGLKVNQKVTAKHHVVRRPTALVSAEVEYTGLEKFVLLTGSRNPARSPGVLTKIPRRKPRSEPRNALDEVYPSASNCQPTGTDVNRINLKPAEEAQGLAASWQSSMALHRRHTAGSELEAAVGVDRLASAHGCNRRKYW